MMSETPKLATDIHVARCRATNCAVDGRALTCEGKVLGMRQRGLGTPPASITVDARGLTFIDSSGLVALMRARDAAADGGVAFRISEPSPARRRVAGLGEELLPATSDDADAKRSPGALEAARQSLGGTYPNT
jgi:hypothetical protein